MFPTGAVYVAYGQGSFVACGSGASFTVAKSPDGFNWTYIPAFLNAAWAAHFNENASSPLWVVAGSGAALFMVSSDLVSFTMSVSTVFSTQATGVAYGKGR